MNMIIKVPNKPKLKSYPSQSQTQFEISALKKENLNLQKEIGKIKAKYTTLESKITLITQEYTNYKHDHPSFDRPLTEQERKQVEECKQCLKRKALERDLNT
jgi:hypothetical protein